MVMETGATTGIFPSDEQTRRWLAAQGREDDFVELAADPGAAYDEIEEIDLGALEPLIALPSSPGQRRSGPRGRRDGDAGRSASAAPSTRRTRTSPIVAAVAARTTAAGASST